MICAAIAGRGWIAVLASDWPPIRLVLVLVAIQATISHFKQSEYHKLPIPTSVSNASSVGLGSTRHG